jgi:hypothetical protein
MNSNMIQSIEKGLQHIEKTNTEKITLYNSRIEFHEDAITKYHDGIHRHRLLFSKVIYESALISNICCENVDKEFNQLFPQVGNDEIPPLRFTQPFNPKIVVEFRDNKAHGQIKLWDAKTGILPNVMVYDTYFVNTDDNPIWYNTTANKAFNREMINDNMHNCNVDTPDVYEYHPKFNTDNEDINALMTYKFEVDNYLNLYEPTTGLYLMFNKTSFPDCSLKFRNFKYAAKQLSNLDLSQIMKYDETNMLEQMDNIVPTNIEEVYRYHHSYRKSKAFKRTDVSMSSVSLDEEQVFSEDNESYTDWETTDDDDENSKTFVQPEQTNLTVDTHDLLSDSPDEKLPLIDISPSGSDETSNFIIDESDETSVDSESEEEKVHPESSVIDNDFTLQEELLEFSRNQQSDAVSVDSEPEEEKVHPESSVIDNDFTLQEELLEFSRNQQSDAVSAKPSIQDNVLWFSKWNDVVEEIKAKCEEFDKEGMEYIY